jgi:hypothetical protein
MEAGLISHFLPAELLAHFKITGVKDVGEIGLKRMVIHIDLEEINTVPQGYDPSLYESKGFYPVTYIQDFPIRGKAVYLGLKRRRWRDKLTKKEIIHNDYTLIAEGSKLTQELSDFLKGTGRDPGRYH